MADESVASVDLRRLAEHGDAEAQCRLGRSYISGDGVPQDYAEAAKWTRLGADQNHAVAQFHLGIMYHQGLGVPQDNVEAVKWYRLAADQGLAGAQANLGQMYTASEDYAEAARWYHRSAQQGLAIAQLHLGIAFDQGRGVPQDYAEAAKWYRLAADQGVAGAQYNLGRMYASGEGVPMDRTTAVKWLRAAAEQDLVLSQKFLASMYADLNDYKEAANWFRHAAERGDPDAQGNLGRLYASGMGVVQDKLLAQIWFALAASQGSRFALSNRASFGPVPGSEIADQIAKAETGDPEAQRDLAMRLYRGDGVQADRGAATLWVKRAAEGGDPWAQTSLAIELGKSKRAEDERESVRWLTLAANQGDPRAHFNLGLCQVLGVGTPIDVEAAAVNYLIASLSGLDDARKCFDLLRPDVHESSWVSILDRVKWPNLTFLMGPLVNGHLDEIRQSQENDDGSDNSLWLEYEREAAETTFKGEGSLLNGALGEKVIAKEIFVGRAIVGGNPFAAVTINLRNLVLENGLPVHWKPKDDDMKAAAGMIAFVEAREWVRYLYTS